MEIRTTAPPTSSPQKDHLSPSRFCLGTTLHLDLFGLVRLMWQAARKAVKLRGGA
jgi:hypothetical protein